MKASFSFLGKSILVALLISCSHSTVQPTTTATWNKLADFWGSPRGNASGFVINDIGYVGTGYDLYNDQYLADFWSYDKSADKWTEIAKFPGAPRSFAAAFALNGKGYVGLGFDGTNPLSDFYQYDPSQNAWTRVADFGTGTASNVSLERLGAIAFTLNGKAFVGSGSSASSGSNNDFWQYDDVNNQWIKIQDLGIGRKNGWVMVIGGFAYVGGGSNTGTTLTDVWKFDPTLTSPWTILENKGVQPAGRELATTFTIDNYGYLSFGSSDSGALADAWQYSPPPLNQWTPVSLKIAGSGVTQSSMIPRTSGIGLTLNNMGYVVAGKTGDQCLDDCWAFEK